MKAFNSLRSKRRFSLTCLLPAICLFIITISACGHSSCIIDVSKPGVPVAGICRGQQIEEFNYQIEGGLYAQLIRNPSFEEIDNKFNPAPTTGWYIIKKGSSEGSCYAQTSTETEMLNGNQVHCLKFNVKSTSSGSVGIANGGYWGIKLENNKLYRVSFWARTDPGYTGSLNATLESNEGAVYAQSADLKSSSGWRHYTCELTTRGITNVSAANRFVIYASSPGNVYLDVITVMPPTWKERPNGLRPDLAEKLAALKLKYIQFPGGCTAESASMDKCWNWKNSIGPLEERAGSTRNRWLYKNDLYFGLDEYFQLCTDLGAEPVYVCSSGISEVPEDKEWFGVCPPEKMQPIIDDILDLIQYCNGPISTEWGARRAVNGHPEPYNLKYIEIGNENGWKTAGEYSQRYAMIRSAIISKYPEMKIMFNGSLQNSGLSGTSGNTVDFTDEHFYLKDLSTLYHKYDSINPECKKICVAEYASSVKGNGGDVIGNYGDALADAVFMLGCERNSERLWWTGYGNYAGFVGHGNFGPCIVWNDALSCFAAPSYYMQKMLFSDNPGTNVVSFTHNTSNCYLSVSADRDSLRNDILVKVVNNKSTSEKVRIVLKGAGKVKQTGDLSMMTGSPADENSLTDPVRVVPVKGTFKAGSTFYYTFPAYSASILRISCL